VKLTNNTMHVLKYFTSNILFAVACILLNACVAAQNVNDPIISGTAWQMVGPGGGGATFIPTFSYYDPREFLVRCDMTGSYLTKDGGSSYRQLNFENGANCFAFDPKDSNTIYIASTVLRRSNDGGKKWKIIFPNKKDVISEAYSGDHATIKIQTSARSLYINKIREIENVIADPLSRKYIYASMGSYFFYSNDAGQTWSRKDLHLHIDYLYGSVGDANDVYIFSKNTIFIFNKRSKKVSHTDIPKTMSPAFSFSAGTKKNTGKIIFYALHDAKLKVNGALSDKIEIWKSGDNGLDWRKIKASSILNETAGMQTGFSKITCAQYDADNACVISNNYTEIKEDGKIIHWNGALKTNDAGTSWNWIWKTGGGSGVYGMQDAKDDSTLKDAWVQTAFGKELIELMDVGIAPHDGNIIILTDWYRVMKTTDDGKTWNEIYSIRKADSTYTTSGLNVTTCYGVHFDPFDSNHLAVSYTDIGFFHSFNRGRSWRRSVAGVPNEWKNTCYWVAFDPVVKNKLWSAWSGMHDIPRGKMTRDPQWKESAVAKGGVCVSVDGGELWKPMITGMGINSPATSIIIDPASPPANRTLYVTVYNKGVFKSADDGKTWSLKNNGLGKNTCAFKIVIAKNGTLFLTVTPTPKHLEGKTGYAFYSGAVYKSTDGAETWTRLNVNDGLLFPNSISIDPVGPNRLYLSCWANISLADLVGSDVALVNGGDKILNMPGGIFMSEDGGAKWKSVFDKKQYVYDVTVDPYHKGRLYCNTFNNAAYRSDNYGKTWEKIKGYDFHWGHRVIVDENDPGKVYLTTYGSGVWHGIPEVERPEKEKDN
jgi:photosystem II stability/assembly factor-like uncharacterized protein